MQDPKPMLTVKEMEAALSPDTPKSTLKIALAVVGGRMYKREGDSFRLLDDKVRSSTKELDDGSEEG